MKTAAGGTVKRKERHMLYNEFQGEKLSMLGMGCMRLPVIDGSDANIDQAQVDEMVDLAFAGGINYFDTAWGYHEGNSEIALGKALARYPRDKFFIADKFPGYDYNNMSKVKEIFYAQLEKTGMEYFDFYLYHNINERNIGWFLDPKFGIHEFLMEMKAEGKIRHLGFSTHGEAPCIREFLAARGEDLELCQIQLNYLDWEFQKAAEKVALLSERGIPVWVMEPVRGGRLVSLGEENDAKLKAMRPDEDVVNWAFRFLQGVTGVTVVLSGMSEAAQMEANLKIFSERKPLTEPECESLLAIARGLTEQGTLPCTSCRYCTTHCPQGLDIPGLVALYNEHHFTKGGFIVPMRTMAMPKEKKPAACIGCRSCEAVCPQGIEISEVMKSLAETEKTFAAAIGADE